MMQKKTDLDLLSQEILERFRDSWFENAVALTLIIVRNKQIVILCPIPPYCVSIDIFLHPFKFALFPKFSSWVGEMEEMREAAEVSWLFSRFHNLCFLHLDYICASFKIHFLERPFLDRQASIGAPYVWDTQWGILIQT